MGLRYSAERLTLEELKVRGRFFLRRYAEEVGLLSDAQAKGLFLSLSNDLQAEFIHSEAVRTKMLEEMRNAIAEVQPTTSPPQEERHVIETSYSRGESVEVNITNHGEVWKRGHVTDTARGGAYVKLDSTRSVDFYFWRRVRPINRDRRPLTQRPFKHLTEAVKMVTFQPPAVSAPPPPSEVSEDALGEVTRMGQLVRAARIAAGFSQRDFGNALNKAQSEISRIERGDALPSDDLLLEIVAATGADLDELMMARDRDRLAFPDIGISNAAPKIQPVNAPQPEQPEPTVVVEEEQPEVVTNPMALTAAPSSQKPDQEPAAQMSDFENFLERFVELVPVPLSKVKRVRWFALARECFNLERES